MDTSTLRFSCHTWDKATKAKVTLENYYSNLISQHLERKQRWENSIDVFKFVDIQILVSNTNYIYRARVEWDFFFQITYSANRQFRENFLVPLCIILLHIFSIICLLQYYYGISNISFEIILYLFLIVKEKLNFAKLILLLSFVVHLFVDMIPKEPILDQVICFNSIWNFSDKFR